MFRRGDKPFIPVHFAHVILPTTSRLSSTIYILLEECESELIIWSNRIRDIKTRNPNSWSRYFTWLNSEHVVKCTHAMQISYSMNHLWRSHPHESEYDSFKWKKSFYLQKSWALSINITSTLKLFLNDKRNFSQCVDSVFQPLVMDSLNTQRYKLCLGIYSAMHIFLKIKTSIKSSLTET